MTEVSSAEVADSLIAFAVEAGVGDFWASTLRISRDLGHTDVAITDALHAIALCGAVLPPDLERLVRSLPRDS